MLELVPELVRTGLALRHLLAGHNAKETAGLFGLERSQLFLWRVRYETEGGVEELAGA